jgi:hypothetical protein
LTAVGSGRRPDPLGTRRVLQDRNKIETALFADLNEPVFHAWRAPFDFFGYLIEHAIDAQLREVLPGGGAYDPRYMAEPVRLKNLDGQSPRQFPRLTGHG